jgi:hypothetical protein
MSKLTADVVPVAVAAEAHVNAPVDAPAAVAAEAPVDAPVAVVAEAPVVNRRL